VTTAIGSPRAIGLMRFEITTPMQNEIPVTGSGRSYALAWKLLSRPQLIGCRPWLGMALSHFRRAVEQQSPETSLGVPSARLWEELNGRFDLDGIVTFSNAWHIWEHIAERNPTPNAWDQELFFGGNAEAASYHEGIKNLAMKQMDFVVGGCASYLRGRRVRAALDLGAGRGVQMSALRNSGIIESAVCIDTPFVVSRSREESPEHTWLPGDLRTIDINPIPSIDLLWVGNLLHHYAPNENQVVLNRFAPKLSPTGVLVVQEYLVGSNGRLGLTAAALGVHFALTTGQGRNYPERFIDAMIEEAVPGLEFDSRLDGAVSSLLFFRRRKP